MEVNSALVDWVKQNWVWMEWFKTQVLFQRLMSLYLFQIIHWLSQNFQF